MADISDNIIREMRIYTLRLDVGPVLNFLHPANPHAVKFEEHAFRTIKFLEREEIINEMEELGYVLVPNIIFSDEQREVWIENE